MKKLLFILPFYLLAFSCNNHKTSTIKDIDGNSYKTIKIGGHYWMLENLNTSTFLNGDKIPQAQTEDEWQKAGLNEKPAWCYYDNTGFFDKETKIIKKYGKLYNKFAIMDKRGLAPLGWHVPTSNEWKLLVDYLGGGKVAGVKMKYSSEWGHNGNGNNDSGFTALPGGARAKNGFYGIMTTGNWWAFLGGACVLSDSKDDVTLLSDFMGTNEFDGLSVRCIKYSDK